MKKIFIFLLMAVASSLSTFADTTYKLLKCERYGTDVMFTYNIINKNDYDLYVNLTKYSKKAFIVYDADGNSYCPTRFTIDTPKTRKTADGWTRLVGLSDEGAPLGSDEIWTNSLCVPSGISLQVRIAVCDVPQSVKQFAFVQLRATSGKDSESQYHFELTWNLQEDAKDLTIIDVK